MMNTVPVDIFDDEPPAASKSIQRPAPEAVRAVAEAVDFRSRQPPPAPGPARRGKPRTGRTEQFACRITPAAAERIYRISQEQDWTIGATVERALAALEEKMRR
jgi:hypothetical protein